MGAFGFNRDEKETTKARKRQEKLNKQAERRQWARDRKVRRESFDRGISIGVAVLFMLIAAAMLSKLQNNDIPTFSSFLAYLKTVPKFDLDWAVIPQANFEISWWDWADEAVNLVTGIINFFGFVTKSATNALFYLLWMLYFFIY